MSRLAGIRVGLAARRLSRALFPLLLATIPSAAVVQSADRGTWQIYYEPSRERVELAVQHYEDAARRHGMTSFGVRPAALRGLPQSQLSSYSGPVDFRLVRDAGTFNFAGRRVHWAIKTMESVERAMLWADPWGERIWEEASDADESALLISVAKKPGAL